MLDVGEPVDPIGSEGAFEHAAVHEVVQVGDGLADGEEHLVHVELAAEQHGDDLGGRARHGAGGAEFGEAVLVVVRELGHARRDPAERESVRRQDQRIGREVEIDTDAVYSGVQKRDLHLKSPDFLNVKQFPKITFASTKVVNAGKAVTVTGDLTLHGVTKPVTVRLLKVGAANDPWGNFRTGYLGELTIKRSEYGVAGMPGGVGEKLKLTIAIEGIRQK